MHNFSILLSLLWLSPPPYATPPGEGILLFQSLHPPLFLFRKGEGAFPGLREQLSTPIWSPEVTVLRQFRFRGKGSEIEKQINLPNTKEGRGFTAV